MPDDSCIMPVGDYLVIIAGLTALIYTLSMVEAGRWCREVQRLVQRRCSNDWSNRWCGTSGRHFKQLSNMSTDSGVASHMERVRHTEPQVRWHIECWHTVTTGSGRFRSTKRVTTFTGDESWPIYVRSQNLLTYTTNC